MGKFIAYARKLRFQIRIVIFLKILKPKYKSLIRIRITVK